MKTQKELLASAKQLYILPLSRAKSGMCDRYQVYCLTDDGLQVLWPSDCQLGKDAKDKLPNQVWTNNKRLPAFHFRLNGCGYSKTFEIKSDLARVLELDSQSLKAETLTGWSPSHV